MDRAFALSIAEACWVRSTDEVITNYSIRARAVLPFFLQPPHDPTFSLIVNML
jgi:hypothetical protein